MTAQTLMAEASCFFCSGNEQWLELALLTRILKSIDPMADTSIETLKAQAQAYCCVSAGLIPAVRLALLAQIANYVSGGISGLTGVTSGLYGAGFPPPGHNAGEVLGVNLNDSTIWYWDGVQWLLFG